MKKISFTKSVTLAAIVAIALSAQAGMTNAATASPTTQNQPASTQIYNKYIALLKVNGQLSQAIAYLNAHIQEASQSDATNMVLRLENAIVSIQSSYEQKIDKSAVQAAISKVYHKNDSIATIISRIKDKQLKALLQEASNNGFKLENAEGNFYPVIDYMIFQKYNKYVAADIKAYIDIMITESDQVALKDGSLMIGYQQLANRAISQEKFIQQFPYSNRAAKIKNLYSSYKITTFYGTNNTPLFDYDTNKMQPNATKGYNMILDQHQNAKSDYLTLLQQFMDMAKSHDYKLTDEVTAFRKTNIPL